MAHPRPIILVIFDGWGYREDKIHNAIAEAATPCFDGLRQKFPHALLAASGESVGLPPGQMGNSEVGHMTIGAGRVVDTDVVRVSRAFQSGEAARNPAFEKLFAHVKRYDSTLHLKGLVSPGGIHSHSRHLHAFLRLAKQQGLSKVVIHAFTDGRDTPPQSAARYLAELEQIMSDLGVGYIATVSGRFYAMDRDHNWDRLARAEQAIFACRGRLCRAKKPSALLAELYETGVLDEHVEPVVFLDDTGRGYKVERNDGILFFNFRADRARMLSQKIMEHRERLNLCFVTMTDYGQRIKAHAAFPPARLQTCLAAEVSRAGLRQAHIAETEKYAHVTYFLNGGREEPHAGEEFVLIDSRRDVKTHDLAPQMRAAEITDKAIEWLRAGTDFIVINYANPDMVGHTANPAATIKAVQAVDQNLSRLVKAAAATKAAMLITADHGNAELNRYPADGQAHTAHTANPVPVILTMPGVRLRDGTLADVAPTILKLLGLPKPRSMTGQSLMEPD